MLVWIDPCVLIMTKMSTKSYKADIKSWRLIVNILLTGSKYLLILKSGESNGEGKQGSKRKQQHWALVEE